MTDCTDPRDAAEHGDGAPEEAEAAGSGRPAEPERVAEVLQQLRSGVRQRRAEVATVAAGSPDGMADGIGEVRHALMTVRSLEYLQEPVAFSHRRRLGRLIVFARKALFHLFLKWFLRPVIEQQNAYNQAASRALEELALGQEKVLRELHAVARRLDELKSPRRDGG